MKPTKGFKIEIPQYNGVTQVKECKGFIIGHENSPKPETKPVITYLTKGLKVTFDLSKAHIYETEEAGDRALLKFAKKYPSLNTDTNKSFIKPHWVTYTRITKRPASQPTYIYVVLRNQLEAEIMGTALNEDNIPSVVGGKAVVVTRKDIMDNMNIEYESEVKEYLYNIAVECDIAIIELTINLPSHASTISKIRREMH